MIAEVCPVLTPESVAENRALERAAKEAWSGWIASTLNPEGLVFGTWTFRDRSSRDRSRPWSVIGASYARDRSEDLVKLIAMSGGRAIVAVEGDARKRRHLHSLSDGGVDAVRAGRAWWGTTQGFTAIREVTNSGGAAATSLYVSKYLKKGDGHVAIGGAGWRASI